MILDVGALRSDPPRIQVTGQIGGNYAPVRFSPDGRSLASAQNRCIVLFDVRKDRLKESQIVKDLPSDQAHSDSIDRIDFSPDGGLMASGSGDGTMKLWDVGSGRMLAAIAIGENGSVFPAFSPSGPLLAVAHARANALWEIGGLTESKAFAPHPDPVGAFAYDPLDGNRLACISVFYDYSQNRIRQTVSLWHFPEVRPQPEEIYDHPGDKEKGLILGKKILVSLALQPRQVAFVRPDGLNLWDFGRSDSRLLALDLPAGLAFSRDGGCLWGVVDEHEIKSWSLEDFGKPKMWSDRLRDRLADQSALGGIVAGDRWALVGSTNKSVYLMRRSDGQKEKDLVSVESSPSAVALSQNESVAAIGAKSGLIYLVRVPGGTQIGRVLGHRDVVLALALSPDGRLLASSGRDGAVHLWDCSRGRPEKVLTLPNVTGRPVIQLAWSPDGNTLALLAENDRVVRLWRIDLLQARLKAMGIY